MNHIRRRSHPALHPVHRWYTHIPLLQYIPAQVICPGPALPQPLVILPDQLPRLVVGILRRVRAPLTTDDVANFTICIPKYLVKRPLRRGIVPHRRYLVGRLGPILHRAIGIGGGGPSVFVALPFTCSRLALLYTGKYQAITS